MTTELSGNDYDIAESERVSIREKYKTIQSEIDDCNDESRLRDILKKF